MGRQPLRLTAHQHLYIYIEAFGTNAFTKAVLFLLFSDITDQYIPPCDCCRAVHAGGMFLCWSKFIQAINSQSTGFLFLIQELFHPKHIILFSGHFI